MESNIIKITKTLFTDPAWNTGNAVKKDISNIMVGVWGTTKRNGELGKKKTSQCSKAMGFTKMEHHFIIPSSVAKFLIRYFRIDRLEGYPQVAAKLSRPQPVRFFCVGDIVKRLNPTFKN